MKKVMTLLAMLAIPFAMMAQTKFHDVELNEATGPVKSITQSGMMGRGEQVINFTQDGKMQAEGLTGQVYDENGYLQKVSRSMDTPQGSMTITTTYKWENGKVASQTMNMMGNDMTVKLTYNDKGAIASQSMNMMGQDVNIPFTDYKYDEKGNWISRKTSMMGQEMEQTRKIEYYE
ncbi:MAG: hypothetical protein K6B13_00800 [Prevotella sp.]|jgi:hypothetical protein|nr:hypothetical protein [Prevotella sp.]